MNYALVLAAGKGTRMQSELPKVLHPIQGCSILERVLNTVSQVIPDTSIVVGHQGDAIIEKFGSRYNFIKQSHPLLGTGHAVLCAKSELAQKPIKNLLVLPGDHPLISSETIQNFIARHEASGAVLSLATIQVPNFNGDYAVFENCGRIIRNAHGQIVRITEYKDASDLERAITEVNVSYYCFNPELLWNNIELLQTNNQAHEYYLTDLVELTAKQGHPIDSYIIQNPAEGMGVNTQDQLAMVTRHIEQVLP